MSQLEVPDIPRANHIELDAQETAVIVIDMQNDFAHPDGALYGEDASSAIPVIAELVERARSAGARVVFTQDWHGEDDPEFAIWGEHAKEGSWGAQIVEGLPARNDDVYIKKLRYDAFYGTSLDHLLRLWGIRNIVIAGTVANICVLHTAGSAALRYYQVTAAQDGIAALTPFDKASALRQITFLYQGDVTSSSDIRFG